MAWSFGDSFDLYATAPDAVNGYWDVGAVVSSIAIAAGRFSGSLAFRWTATVNTTLTKTSGINDAVHHFVCAFQQTAAITGSTLGLYFELFDGATAQCSVVFRSDGAILLTSGGPAGTVLATYTGAVTVINTWYAFEFEVVINNATGSFTVRKNGNTVADFTAASLNTRPTSTNAYANKVQVGMNTGINSQSLDDFFWRSDASSVAWLGDIRCYARMPASDQSLTFSRSTGASNFSCVDEAQQNAFTDYVFDSNPGDQDFYGVGSIASVPVAVIATTVRGYMTKSDAGGRQAAVQLKSGATTVASSPQLLTTSGWQWAWRTDLIDPNTGLAWLPANVDNAQIGPQVVA